MFKQYHKTKIILLLSDILCVNLAIILTIWLRYNSAIGEFQQEYFSWIRYLQLAIMTLVYFPIFRELELYKSRIFTTKLYQIQQLIKAEFVGLLIIIVLTFILRAGFITHSRGNYLLFLILNTFILIIVRIGILQPFYFYLLHNPILKQQILILGSGRSAQLFAGKVLNNSQLGLDIIGFLDDDEDKQNMHILDKPILGKISDLGKVLEQYSKIRAIYIAIDAISYNNLLNILDVCKATGLPTTVLSEHFRIIKEKNVDGQEFETIEAITIRKNASQLSWFAKRIIDFVASLIALILLSPFFIAISIIIKLTSPGSVFYKAEVIGHNGEKFTWNKFRTMCVNNDDTKHRELIKNIIKNGQSGKKLQNDSRITFIGKFLRHYSLDELPQLFNVLKGEMSLIGPRPCLPYEYELFEEWHKKRFSILPGMSGLWQVSGRNEVSFNDKVILDLYYIENFSLLLDIKILLKTITVIINGRGGV